jgi:hypothetical protein
MARGMLQFPPSRAAPIFDKWKATVESLFYFLEEGCPGGHSSVRLWRPCHGGAPAASVLPLPGPASILPDIVL